MGQTGGSSSAEVIILFNFDIFEAEQALSWPNLPIFFPTFGSVCLRSRRGVTRDFGARRAPLLKWPVKLQFQTTQPSRIAYKLKGMLDFWVGKTHVNDKSGIAGEWTD